MSIFKKITVLFAISLSLMLIIGYKINEINMQRLESAVVQKYLQDAKKIFLLLAVSNEEQMHVQLQRMGLKKVQDISDGYEKVLLVQPHSFGELKIVHEDGEYLLYIKYMDEEITLKDEELQKSFSKEWLLNLLVVLDIAVLLAILLIILRMLSPLAALKEKMQNFACAKPSDYAQIKTNDEIQSVILTYERMQKNIKNLISSREELLRDVGHELKTPISKGLFALEKIEPSVSKEIVQKSLSELDRLSAELLEIERIHALDEIKTERFKAETLILGALSRLMLEDESLIKIEVQDDFAINGDMGYLSLALKNLIDNAVKYAQSYPVEVIAKSGSITVKNKAPALSRDISYYLDAFTQEDASRNKKGYGLGLNIVKKVLERHGYTLKYEYKNGYHLFSIVFC